MFAIVANGVAWPIVYHFTQNWLVGYSFRIDPEVGTYASSGLLALTVALIPIALQARRAANADPAETLRHE